MDEIFRLNKPEPQESKQQETKEIKLDDDDDDDPFSFSNKAPSNKASNPTPTPTQTPTLTPATTPAAINIQPIITSQKSQDDEKDKESLSSSLKKQVYLCL